MPPAVFMPLISRVFILTCARVEDLSGKLETGHKPVEYGRNSHRHIGNT